MNLILKQPNGMNITAGTWGVTNGNLLRVYATFPNDRQPIVIAGVHRFGRFGGKADGDPLANAYLLSAAPDLYYALSRLEEFGHTDQTWHLAKRALRKARGEI